MVDKHAAIRGTFGYLDPEYRDRLLLHMEVELARNHPNKCTTIDRHIVSSTISYCTYMILAEKKV